MAGVEAKAKVLRKGLDGLAGKHPEMILDIRGLGMMIGVKVAPPVGDVINALREKRLLTVPAGDNMVRLLPPLIINQQEVQQLIDNLLSLFSIQQQHPHAIQAPIGSPAWRNTFSRMNEVMGSVREFCDSDTQAWYALHLLFSAVATSAEAERLNRQSPLREQQRESLKEMPLENKASLLPIIEQHAHLDESQRFVKLIDHAICHLIPALARSGNRLEEEPHET